jgi:hypothetical protein
MINHQGMLFLTPSTNENNAISDMIWEQKPTDPHKGG